MEKIETSCSQSERKGCAKMAMLDVPKKEPLVGGEEELAYKRANMLY
jgi:hypothetical protein